MSAKKKSKAVVIETEYGQRVSDKGRILGPIPVNDKIKCPRCGGGMIKKVNYKGNEFFGCWEWPYCLGSRNGGKKNQSRSCRLVSIDQGTCLDNATGEYELDDEDLIFEELYNPDNW